MFFSFSHLSFKFFSEVRRPRRFVFKGRPSLCRLIHVLGRHKVTAIRKFLCRAACIALFSPYETPSFPHRNVSDVKDFSCPSMFRSFSCRGRKRTFSLFLFARISRLITRYAPALDNFRQKQCPLIWSKKRKRVDKSSFADISYICKSNRGECKIGRTADGYKRTYCKQH